jgi:hypothetical protein
MMTTMMIRMGMRFSFGFMTGAIRASSIFYTCFSHRHHSLRTTPFEWSLLLYHVLE